MADEKPLTTDPEQRQADTDASRKQSGLNPVPPREDRDATPDRKGDGTKETDGAAGPGA